MKRHEEEYLLGYGLEHYKEKSQSSQDSGNGEGKWYQRMDIGFVCGDRHTVVRFISMDNYSIARTPNE